MIEEVQRLTANGRQLGRTASQAVGYREVIEFLSGERDRASMLERIKTRTRQFAKRQGVWFRSLSECRFVDIEGEVDANQLAEQYRCVGQSSVALEHSQPEYSRCIHAFRPDRPHHDSPGPMIAQDEVLGAVA